MKHPVRAGVAAGLVALALAAGGVVLATREDEGQRGHPKAAASSAPTAAPGPDSSEPPRALVLGDSNVAWADVPVREALAQAGLVGQLSAVPNVGLKDFDSYWRTVVPDLVASQDPDVVVVALGANDVHIAENVELFAARLDEMMRAIGERRVVWVTHVDERPVVGSSAQRINVAIRAAPARWSNLAVLDLAPLINANTALLLPDLLHFSAFGQVVYGREIAVAIQRTALVPSGFAVTLPPAPLPAVGIPTG